MTKTKKPQTMTPKTKKAVKASYKGKVCYETMCRNSTECSHLQNLYNAEEVKVGFYALMYMNYIIVNEERVELGEPVEIVIYVELDQEGNPIWSEPDHITEVTVDLF